MNKTIRWVNETKWCGIQREFGHIFRTSPQFLPHFKPVSSALHPSFFRTSSLFLPHFKPISSALQTCYFRASNLFRPAYKVASAISCCMFMACALPSFGLFQRNDSAGVWQIQFLDCDSTEDDGNISNSRRLLAASFPPTSSGRSLPTISCTPPCIWHKAYHWSAVRSVSG